MLGVGDCVDESDGVAVRVGDDDCDGDTLTLPVEERLGVPDSDGLPVPELLGERERVIELLEVGELVTEQLGVAELLGVCACVGLAVARCVGLIDADAVVVILRVGSGDAVDN